MDIEGMTPPAQAVWRTDFSDAAVTGHAADGIATPRGGDQGDYFSYAAQTSVLICTGNTADHPYSEHLATMTQTLGCRVLDILPIADAAERLSGFVALDAVILCCSGDEPGLDALLSRLDALEEAGTISLLVVTDLPGLDRVHALVHSHSTLILCAPEPSDIAAALTVLATQDRQTLHLHDIGTEADEKRFDLLSNQLLKLNQMIETLVQDKSPGEIGARFGKYTDAVKSPERSYHGFPPDDALDVPAIHAHQVRALLRTRRLREQILGQDLFADPAWDIMLDLLAARLENTAVSVSSLCIAAAVPPTTALRWIRQLTDRGLLERQADPKDGRRIFIGLSDNGYSAVVRWFQESRVHFQILLKSTNKSRTN